MKKIIVTIVVLSLFLQIPTSNFAYAIDENDNTNILLNKANNLPEYMRFYRVDGVSLSFYFLPLNNDEIAKLPPEQKKYYKTCYKIDKYLQKNKFQKAFKLIAKKFPDDVTYLPALTAYFHYQYANKKYKAALLTLKLIKSANNDKLLNNQNIDLILADLYYISGDYEQAIIEFEKLTCLENSDFINYRLTQSYFALNSYTNAIYYAKKVSSDYSAYYDVIDLLFVSYYRTKNNEMARKIALKGLELAPNSPVYNFRVGDLTANKKEKLKYFYKTLDYYIGQNDINNALPLLNGEITPIENELLDNACKNIKGFFVKPNWEKIQSEDYHLMSGIVLVNRHNNFFSSIHNCTDKYTGNDLKACLTKVNEEQEKISHKLIAERNEQIRYAQEQERIRQMQLMNANLMYSNQLRAQQNYIQNRPRYYNSTTTQYGNTYYTNTYSY